jgi:hypothetical protein
MQNGALCRLNLAKREPPGGDCDSDIEHQQLLPSLGRETSRRRTCGHDPRDDEAHGREFHLLQLSGAADTGPPSANGLALLRKPIELRTDQHRDMLAGKDEV